MSISSDIAQDASAATPVAEQRAQDWAWGFTEGWSSPAGPQAFVEHFRPLLAEDIVLRQPQLPPTVGFEAFERDFVAPLFALFPDIRGEVKRWVSDGETLYIELTLRGTLVGGHALAWRVCDRVMLRDGVAIERESYFDPSPLLAAIVRSPRAWPAFIRLRAGRAINRIATTRRTR
jgi:ketosteroid isomerase-like protein